MLGSHPHLATLAAPWWSLQPLRCYSPDGRLKESNQCIAQLANKFNMDDLMDGLLWFIMAAHLQKVNPLQKVYGILHFKLKE